jgi:HEAT repeat protein
MAGIWGCAFSLSSRVPKKNIPSDIPSDLRKEIETLYSLSSVKRARAVRSLGEMGDRATPAIPFLTGMLADNTRIREEFKDKFALPGDEAVKALVNIGKPGVKPLILVLEDKDPSVQKRAAESLRGIGDRRAIEPLIAVLNKGESTARLEAAKGLGQFRDPRAIESLVRALKYDHWDVRKESVESLKKIEGGIGRAIELLTIALTEGEAWNIRENITWALGEMDDKRAIETLITALKDEDTSVRKSAARSLRKITGKNFGQNQAAWENWYNKQSKK